MTDDPSNNEVGCNSPKTENDPTNQQDDDSDQGSDVATEDRRVDSESNSESNTETEPEHSSTTDRADGSTDAATDVGSSDDSVEAERADTDESRDDDPSVDYSDPEYYLSRELSKLEFSSRVLEEAFDDENPPLERVKFLSVFTDITDEFFMKRVGGLKQQLVADITEKSPDGRTPREQWEEVIDTAEPLMCRAATCYHEYVNPALAEAGIEIVKYDELSAVEQQTLDDYFETSILPTLTPLTVNPAKPFPHISNLSLSLGVLTRSDSAAEPTFSRIKIPQNRPRLVQVSNDDRFVLLETLIEANLTQLFPDLEILESSTFRVTRNAEVRRNEEVAEDLIQRTEEVIEQRRFATVVRLEIEKTMSDRMLRPLLTNLDVTEPEVFRLPAPLDFRGLESLLSLDRPDLKLPEWSPRPHPRLATRPGEHQESIFETIQNEDVLVHHPYHSFAGSVQRFLDEAANDPQVLAIKAAIYRTASDSQVIQRLIDAAKNGKQVAVMVELKARFDEENNLEWAKTLEEEGIHVAYGTIGYKTHTKATLVVREESDGVKLYSHIGTGNYHSKTAKRYEDLGLFTMREDIGQDLVKLFNYFTGHSFHDEYRELLVAPGNMRQRFVDLIRREAEHARAGNSARIVAKMNRLEDPQIIEELYRASGAGVDIDLIVRDICRLRPGVPEVSPTINVVSIIDRFLEHSRIFSFHNGGDTEYYIGSADWMVRNLDNRVEAVTPIRNDRLKERLKEILELCLADNTSTWEMQPDGTYTQTRSDNETVRSVQQTLMDAARRDDPTS